VAIEAVGVGGAAGDVGDPDGVFPEAYGIDPAGAVLVRPDGFVCWRSPGPAGSDPAQELERVLRAVLDRAGAGGRQAPQGQRPAP
jgi:putative polyketide hydroxylase